MTRNYASFYIPAAQRILDEGARLVADVKKRYKHFDMDGVQIYLPYYHKYGFMIFWGDKVFFSRMYVGYYGLRDFECFLKRIVNND